MITIKINLVTGIFLIESSNYFFNTLKIMYTAKQWSCQFYKNKINLHIRSVSNYCRYLLD